MHTIMTDARPATCKAWCIGHDPGAPELCVGVEEITPASDFYPADSIGLSYTPETGTVIAIGDKYMPLHQARGYALALLRQIERARLGESLLVEVNR